MAETEQALWYVVHTYSGYEKKVSRDLEIMVENRHLQHLIQEVKMPVEKVLEINKKSGKEELVEHKLFPGYVLVKMIMTDESWYIVRNTRGVTGFVGAATKPIPLSEDEVAKLGVETVKRTVDFKVGDNVEIVEGPFKSFVGPVESNDMEAGTVRILVSMLGRETPTELELDQVRPL